MRRLLVASILIFVAAISVVSVNGQELRQERINSAIQSAETICLVGKRYKFESDADGSLTIFKLQPGGQGKLHIDKSDVTGGVLFENEGIRRFVDNDIRTCMQEEWPRILAAGEAPLGSAVAPSGPGFPSIDLIRNPEKAEMLDTVTTGDGSLVGVHQVSLYSCNIRKDNIRCFLTLTNLSPGIREYRIDELFDKRTFLLDNFHDKHYKIHGFWLGGREQQQPTIEISQNDTVWFALEFDQAASDITGAKLIFSAFKGGELSWRATPH